jgi:DNA-binding NarL/FixJ family response regulator
VNPTRIMVVDDHPLYRMGITALISTRQDMLTIAEVDTGEEAVEKFSVHKPDIVLMDLRLPGMGGVDAIRAIRKLAPASRFIVLTTYEGDEDIHQALEAGASGYLVKGMPSDFLIDAIKKVCAGGSFVPPPVAEALKARRPESALSAREREVLALLVAGNSNKAIADKLFISEATVKCHVSVILMRLKVEDRTQAVLVALQRGLEHL